MASSIISILKFIVSPFTPCLKDIFLPDEQGACSLLPKVRDELRQLKERKITDDEDFPCSVSSYSDRDKFKWMNKIQGILPIGQIIWPGTHYSATYKIGIPFITRPFGQRQTMSIYQQLLNGVRFLDIRVQQDRVVCYGSMLCDATNISEIIKDIRSFLKITVSEIIILEIQTERGLSDPENFEDYLVEELGDLLIYEDDKVFLKSISEVLPRRIICIWRSNAPKLSNKEEGLIWSGKYLECDEIDTQMPLTKFDGNMKNLTSRNSASSTNNFFYKVEHTLNPKTSTIWESLLIWPKHVIFLSKRINGFARPFLAKCHKEGILHRLQICSVDFVDDDFISACIGLNYEVRTIKLNEDTAVVTEEELNPQTDTTETNEVVQEISEDSSGRNENTAVTLEEVNTETDVTYINEVAEERPELNSEETSLLNISSTESSNMNIGNNNSIHGINTNVNGNASILWESCETIQIEPKDMKITHIEDYKCWRWVHHEWFPSISYKAAQLLEIRSLHVSRDCKIDTLPQGIRYEVLFCLKMLDSAFGWESPIQLRLVLPDGSVQENPVILDLTPTNTLFLPVGNFVKTPDMKGAIKFSIEQLDNSLKGGIVVEGVRIQPHFVDIILPRDLSISSGDDGKCWLGMSIPSSFAKRYIYVVEAGNVRNFRVSGQFETGELLVGCTYRVGFLIAMESYATGWESPTKLTLVLPDGSSQQNLICESFKDFPIENIDIKIYAGEFKMTPELIGKLDFSMENNNDVEKSGMVIQLAFIEERH